MLTNIRIFRWVVTFAVATLLMTACQEKEENTTQPETAKRAAEVLATVNGEPITSVDVSKRIRAIRGDINREEVGATTWQRLTETALESEIIERLILQEAKKKEMAVPEDQVKSDLVRTREVMGEEAFAKMLNEQGATEAEFKTYLSERLLIDLFKQKLYETIYLAEEDVVQYYQGHPERFTEPTRLKMHILIYPSGEEADAALKKISEGAFFKDVAADFVAGGGKEHLTRPMPLESMPEGMKAVLATAKEGGTYVYVAPDGVYLMNVREVIADRSRNFEEAREDVEAHLLDGRKVKVLDNWYQAMLKKAEIDFSPGHGSDEK